MNLIRVYVEFTDDTEVEPLCSDIADVLMRHGFGVDEEDSIRSLISVKNTPIELPEPETLAQLAMDDSTFIVMVGATEDD